MKKEHHYNIELNWTGNKGTGTATYESYGREHTLSVKSKPDLYGSSDAAFMGDGSRYNPEEMLVSSLSACHMLWYLHLCSTARVVVSSYSDRPEGSLALTANGSGSFKEGHPAPACSGDFGGNDRRCQSFASRG